MTRILVDRAHTAFEASRKIIAGMFEGISPDDYCHQPIAGANHAMWIMGHLGTVDQYFLKRLGGRADTQFDEFRNVFFMKSEPKPDLAGYPPVPAVREYFDASRQSLRDWLETFDDERLGAPLPAPFDKFQPNYTALFGHLTWHEGMHAGQLSVVRKSLGLAPMFG